jgi:SAM-dependent methyltransferase
LPPPELARRSLAADEPDPLGTFDRLGRAHRQMILDLLPDDWSFEGRRVLDFGCGAGAVARQFLGEAEVADLYACDVHEPSIAWLQGHLAPPLKVMHNREAPPLPLPDGHFQLIVAIGVLTVMAVHWSDWLVELHRLLDTDGVLIATVTGATMAEQIAGQPWDPDRVGMNVLGLGEWRPMVLHSPWWIRSHWGRIFEVDLREGASACGHDLVLLRKKAATCSPAELERPDPHDPREALAMLAQVRQFQRELLSGYEQREALRAELVHQRKGSSDGRCDREGG